MAKKQLSEIHQALQRTVNAKLHIEKAGASVGCAIGNPKERVCVSYREQAIIYLEKAIEQLDIDKQSSQIISIRSLLKFDLIRSLRSLTSEQRETLLLDPKWMFHFNTLDPLSSDVGHTSTACLLAWNNAMDLLTPFIGKAAVVIQKKKLDSINPVKKRAPGPGTKKVIRAMKKAVKEINLKNTKSAGKGYQFLKIRQIIKQGDEHLRKGKWEPVTEAVGKRKNKIHLPIRRKIIFKKKVAKKSPAKRKKR